MPASCLRMVRIPLYVASMTKMTDTYKVHRFISPEVLILNVYGAEGMLIEQHQFMGMFTADAYAQDVEKDSCDAYQGKTAD